MKTNKKGNTKVQGIKGSKEEKEEISVKEVVVNEEKVSKKGKKVKKGDKPSGKEKKPKKEVDITEEVIANRKVKYIYPDDVKDTLSRKTWRQKTRNKLHQLELTLSRIKDTESKDYKKALNEYKAFKKSILKPEQEA